MLNILGTIFLLIGLGGIVFLIFQKREILAQENFTPVTRKKHKLVFFNKIKKIKPYSSIGGTNIIKKILIKTKIFFIKCENGIDGWLQKISQSRKFDEDYWDKIKRKK